MAEKLKFAGVDTIGARLTTACTEAIRRHPESVVDAWRYVGAVFGHELVRGLMNDMQRNAPAKEPTSPPEPSRAFDKIAAGLNEALEIARGNAEPTKLYVPLAPYKPRVIPKERLEKRRQQGLAVRSKFKNSGGISWSDVSWHELYGLARDGTEAAALLAAGPANVPNDGRTVDDVLGLKKIDEIIAPMRAQK